MNDYSSPEYKDLYKEILIDYNWIWGKFSPIPYPTLTNLHHVQSQSTAKITRTSNQFT